MFVESTEANREKCVCAGCPTYTECMTLEEEMLFCGTGLTMCEDVERNGCECPACLVHAEYSLAGMFYCFSGPAE
jgi:hypothetical protein